MTGELTPGDITKGLDESQLRAVIAPQQPLLVVAGPGSGKTRVLTHRVATLIENGVQPHKILAVTFTNKAAGEMRERLAGLVGDDANRKLWVATFHSACARILRIEHEAAGLPKSFSILDVADASKILREVVTKAGVCDKTEVKDYVKTIRNDISWCKNRGIDLSQIEEVSTLNGSVDIAYKYSQALKSAGAVDFDDILLLTEKLFRSGTEVAEKWASRFDCVLVDEFQDTNPIQMGLVRHLVSKSRNLTAVGDLDQSIYAFRAADPAGMSGFTDEFPNASVVVLEKNYRSSPEIVAVSTSIIGSNPAKHRAIQTAHNSSGAEVVLRSCSTDRKEARWVVSMISSLGGNLSDHAILVRTNSQTRVLEEALLDAGLAYSLVGTVKFYDRAEVKDTMAWMRAAVNTFEPVAFERAATVPKRGIGPASISAIRDIAEQNSCNLHVAAQQFAAQGGRGSKQVAEFMAELLDVRAKLAESGPVAGLRRILAAGVSAHIAKLDNAVERKDNIDQLLAAAAEFVEDGVDTEGNKVADLPLPEQVVAFLNHVALVSAADGNDTQSVSVMTIHAAKGREFPNVYVVGVEEDILPHSRSESSADLQEERRLLFVATSRAEERLFISYARQRYQWGDVAATYPSRFLADLPAEVRKEEEKEQVTTFGYEPKPYGKHNYTSKKKTPQRAPVGSWESGTRKKFREQREERRSAAAARPEQGPRLDPQAISVGDSVSHKVFGDGMITTVSGNDIQVKFADKTRVLDISMAPLEKK